MEQYAISLKGVKKSFRVFYDKGTSLKEKVLFKNRRRSEIHEVLKGIDLDVRPGEAVGIIGENGCGKSTLLKLLSRILYPNEGTVEMRGRVSALIELGAGFHPDMTGRENIYTNAAIFGLSRKEIDERLDAIIDFSELEQHIDSPVRTYSSGMYMRLAFSVAINVDADILLVDEILAVGDAAFQAKCFNKLRSIKQSGTTIVIVSHALSQIEQICDRSIWIKDGVIEEQGKPADVTIRYLDYMGRKLGGKQGEKPQQTENSAQQSGESSAIENGDNRWGNGEARITDIRLLDKSGAPCSSIATGDTLNIEFDYKVYSPLDKPVIGFGLFRNDGIQCYGSNTQIEHIEDIELHESGTVSCRLEHVDLLPGEYFVDLAIHREDGFAYDYFRFARSFTVYSGLSDVGLFRIGHSWSFSEPKD